MKGIATLIIALVLIITKPEYSLACSCGDESSVSDALKYSNIVFNGIVLSRTTTTDLPKYGVNVVGNPNSSSYTALLARHQLQFLKSAF
jgi:hypothetical protein